MASSTVGPLSNWIIRPRFESAPWQPSWSLYDRRNAGAPVAAAAAPSSAASSASSVSGKTRADRFGRHGNAPSARRISRIRSNEPWRCNV